MVWSYLDTKALALLHALRLNKDVDQVAARRQSEAWMATTIPIAFVCPPKCVGRRREPYSDIEVLRFSRRYVDPRVCGKTGDVVDLDRFPAWADNALKRNWLNGASPSPRRGEGNDWFLNCPSVSASHAAARGSQRTIVDRGPTLVAHGFLGCVPHAVNF